MGIYGSVILVDVLSSYSNIRVESAAIKLKSKQGTDSKGQQPTSQIEKSKSLEEK